MTGTSFAVWAPNARGVRVVGDFNYWSGRGLPDALARLVRRLGAVRPRRRRRAPGTSSSILGADGVWREKADPMAFATEVPPATASVVYTDRLRVGRRRLAGAQRAETHWHAAPMSIYEVHLGSWRQGLSYRELADELVDYVRETGLHARRVPAGGRAPVRRLVGLPGDVLLRADRRGSAPRTTSATSSTGCTRPASA